MKKSIVILLAILLLSACDYRQSTRPEKQSSAQAKATQLTFECENRPCWSQVGLVVGKIGKAIWTCTGSIMGQSNQVLVSRDCIQNIVSSGGGCSNKLALRFADSQQVFTCSEVSVLDDEYGLIQFNEELPAASGAGQTDLTRTQQLMRVGFQVRGSRVLQISKECQVVHGSLLNTKQADHKSTRVLVKDCDFSSDLGTTALVTKDGGAVALIDSQSASRLKQQQAKLSHFKGPMALATMALSTSVAAYEDSARVLRVELLSQMQVELENEIVRQNAYFQWRPQLLKLKKSSTTLVPSCVKELAWTELNEKRWRGLTQAASGGLVVSPEIPIWQLSQVLDSMGRPMFELNSTEKYEPYFILTNPTSVGVDVELRVKPEGVVWQEKQVGRCR